MEQRNAENAAPDDVLKALDNLSTLLAHLPAALPIKLPHESNFGCFVAKPFTLDAEKLEHTEDEVATLSEMLKVAFGWNARTTGDGIVPVLERGEAICAVPEVLRDFFDRFPENNVLKKWIFDIEIGVRKAFEKHKAKMPSPATGSELTSIDGSFTVSENLGSSLKRTRSENEGEELPTASGRGRPPDMLMGKLIIKNKRGGDGKVVSWSCIAPGCDHTAKGAPQVSRVFKHSTKCKELKEHDEALWKECLKASSTEALGYKLENSSAAPTREDVASKGATSDYTEIERPEKRIKVQSTLNAAPFKQAGKMRQKEEREKFQNSVDHLVMQLICVRGMVPSIVDSAEWKDLMRTLNPAYTPTSATTFTMKHIPHEANHIREKQVKILQANRNLTLTFDGTQVRRPQSVYTAHATTPRRESYLLGGHEGSGERHTTEWIKGHMQKTMKEIGMELFSGACSDSTNVTKAGRRELASEMILLINLNDCVHHIQNTIGDITRLDEFKPMTKSLKATMNHFSKSTLSTTLLRKERNVAGTDEPVKALQKIGKTRFGTYWLATTSLEPCLSGIRNLTERGEIKFKNAELQSMFKTRANGKLGVFEQDISRYNHIVAPFIRSLWSLEAATLTDTKWRLVFLTHSTMHQALEVPEILQLILSHIYNPKTLDSHHWRDTTWRRGPRSLEITTVNSLARTCKSFSKPALDLLWYHQTNLIFLLNCLPNDVLGRKNRGHGPGQLILKRALKQEDFERVDIYAHRIRYLGGPETIGPVETREHVDMMVYPTIVSKRSLWGLGPLLPNLSRMTIGLEKFQNLAWYPRLIIGPRLRGVDLVGFRDDLEDLDYDIHWENIFTILLPVLPSLTSISFPVYTPYSHPADGDIHTFDERHAVPMKMMQAILSPTVLDIISVPLDAGTLRHIATLKTIEVLAISIITVVPDDPLVQNLPELPNLLELRLEANEPNFCCTYIRQVGPKNLRTLRVVRVEMSPHLWNTERFIKSLKTSRFLSNVDRLEIITPTYEAKPNPEIPPITHNTIVQLSHFTNLRSIRLHLNGEVHLGVDSLEAIASIWPNLQVLDLRTRTRLGNGNPQISLNDLLAVSVKLPFLKELRLRVNALEEPMYATLALPNSGIAAPELEIFDVCTTPIFKSNVEMVATLLGPAFPNLRKLLYGWEWPERSGEELLEAELSYQERTSLKGWERVKQILLPNR